MIYAFLILLGLCFGSFVSALTWRIKKQAEIASQKTKGSIAHTKKATKSTDNYSIVHGRSMCSLCGHQLEVLDLIPIISWLRLRGRCRYCHKKIADSPLVEVAMALLFIASYMFWPYKIAGAELLIFGFWLVLLVGFVALAVYDLKWMELPNRVVYPLLVISLAFRVAQALASGPNVIREATLGAIVIGGLFLVLFYVSGGRWIGGGDVKLGFVLGTWLGGPLASLMALFLASLLGTIIAIPLMIMTKERPRRAIKLPFGPFLIAATILVQLLGAQAISLYRSMLGLPS